MKLLAGVLIGFGLSWISILIGIKYRVFREVADEELIDELIVENQAYKKVIDKWRDESDQTYWG